MEKVSIKGIAIGTICTLLLSMIAAFGLMFSFIDISLINQPPEKFQAAVSALNNLTSYLLFSLPLGLVATSAGGYITARIAKRAYFLNSGLIGLVGIIIGLFFTEDLPLWFNVISLLLTIPAALLGGYLAKSNHSSQLIA